MSTNIIKKFVIAVSVLIFIIGVGSYLLTPLLVFSQPSGGPDVTNPTWVYQLNVNDEYTLPTTDGTAGQVFVTDGAGTVSFSSTVGSAAPVGAKYITQTADGTLTNEQALGALATGILKSTTTTGVVSIASAVDLPITDAGGLITGTEVEAALQENRTAININTAKATESTTVSDTATVDLTLSTYEISADVIPGGIDHDGLAGLTDDDHSIYPLLLGRSGGQTLIGGTDASDGLTFSSSSNATKGLITLGSTLYVDEVNERVGIGTATPGNTLTLSGASNPIIRVNGANDGGAAFFYNSQTGVGQDRATIAVNAYYDGSWHLVNNSIPSWLFQLDTVTDTFTVRRADVGSTTISQKMQISSDGYLNVGLGTPIAEVDITSEDSGSALYFQNDSSGSLITDGANLILYGTNFNIVNRETGDIGFYTATSPTVVSQKAVILNDGSMGIGTAGPDRLLDVLDASNPQLRLTHTDGSKFTDFQVDTNHDLTVTPSSTGQVILKPTTDSSDFFQVMDADGGNPVLNVDSTNERVGIGTDSPSYPLHVKNAGTSQYVASFEQSANAAHLLGIYEGASDDASLYMKDGVDTKVQLHTNGYTFFTGGNVGVGIVSPAATLHVKGTDYPVERIERDAVSSTSGDWATQSLVLSTSGTPDAGMGIYQMYDIKTNNIGRIGFQQGSPGQYGNFIVKTANGANPATRMVILEMGYMGVGTTSPNRTLEALHTTAPQFRLTHTDDSKFADFQVDTNHDLTVTPSSTGQVILKPTTDSTDFFQVADADGGTSVLNVDSVNERVGIGTDAPDYDLHVEGWLYGTSGLYLKDVAPAVRVEAYTSAGSSAQWQTRKSHGTPSSPSAVTDGSRIGNFGFLAHDGTDNNTTAAALNVVVDGSVASNSIPAKFIFEAIRPGDTSRTKQMVIRSSGHVGIDNTTPDTILDVNGAITLREKSADPSDPDEGSTAIWMSDGTGSGDDGDIMVKITAGGSTKTITLIDFSTF